MIDILFLAKGRPEFTEESWKHLKKNTPRDQATIWIFTDGDTSQFFDFSKFEITQQFGGPVACMNGFLDTLEAAEARGRPKGEFIAKIDNDTIVPLGWLAECADIMNRYPELDLLGIEPWTPDTELFPVNMMQPGGYLRTSPPVRQANGIPLRFLNWSSHIGGIGMFRRSAFERFGRPTPNTSDGRYGFTEWQWRSGLMTKAFIEPPLPVFLLDHLPFEPWKSLSAKYEAEGVQRRQWGFYDPIKHRALWDWWLSLPPAKKEKLAVDVGGPQNK